MKRHLCDAGQQINDKLDIAITGKYRDAIRRHLAEYFWHLNGINRLGGCNKCWREY